MLSHSLKKHFKMKIISSNLIEVGMVETKIFFSVLNYKQITELDREKKECEYGKRATDNFLKKIFSLQSEIKVIFIFFVSFYRNIFIVNLAISGEHKIQQKKFIQFWVCQKSNFLKEILKCLMSIKECCHTHHLKMLVYI